MSQQAASEVENEVPDAPEVEEEQQVEGDKPEAGGEAETDQQDRIAISIGDESPASDEEETQQAPEWVKNLRKKHRDEQQRRRELEAEVERLKAPKAVEVGEKPTLGACDYDEDRFERELDEWKARKAKQDAKAQEQRKAEEAAQTAHNARVQSYESEKKDLSKQVDDFEEAESAVRGSFSALQQNLLIAAVEQPAKVVFALGTNSKEAQRIASITDPVQFVAAVVRLETKMKVTPRKAAPLPEATVRGGSPVRSDKTLERLEAEADKTGDRSKVVAYRRQQKQRAAT